jgi:hypothetical protein
MRSENRIVYVKSSGYAPEYRPTPLQSLRQRQSKCSRARPWHCRSQKGTGDYRQKSGIAPRVSLPINQRRVQSCFQDRHETTRCAGIGVGRKAVRTSKGEEAFAQIAQTQTGCRTQVAFRTIRMPGRRLNPGIAPSPSSSPPARQGTRSWTTISNRFIRASLTAISRSRRGI